MHAGCIPCILKVLFGKLMVCEPYSKLRKGGCIGDDIGTITGLIIKGGTWSLDNN